jgi:hypothetical protein
MKKRRTIVIFCVVLAAFSMLVACANKEDAEIDYLEWTFEDWRMADDEARNACVMEYERYARETYWGEEVTDADLEDITDMDKEALKLTLGARLFVSEGATVRQIIDEIKAQVE